MTTTAEKKRARSIVGHAVEQGTIAPGPCVDCGASKTQAHHEDYSKPLEVTWLCSACHGLRHTKHPIAKFCENCGGLYTPHKTKRARAKTCSKACRAALIAKTMRERPVPTRPTWTKLDETRAREIRRRFETGERNLHALGRAFSVHHSTIALIVKGETWRERKPNRSLEIALSVDVPELPA